MARAPLRFLRAARWKWRKRNAARARYARVPRRVKMLPPRSNEAMLLFMFCLGVVAHAGA